MDDNFITFYKGEIIFLEGQSSDCAYIIESGNVGIFRNDIFGNRTLVRNLGKNDLFGEMGLIDKYPRSATAIALNETQCMILERSRFDYLLKTNPHFVTNLIKSLTEKLRTTISSFKESSISSTTKITNKTIETIKSKKGD